MYPEISIIISTYNSVVWLEKVLTSYLYQSFTNFEIIIADDGSGFETQLLINHFKNNTTLNIVHVWHKDDGFQKSKILNKAIIKCSSDYILMTDGDCVVRNDFVEQHIKYRKKGHFLSGGYFKLPKTISDIITPEDIKNQSCFNIDWLLYHGLKKSFKNHKITAKKLKAKFLNKFTTTKATWNGHNASGWKKDIIRVNGMDERMQYGGQDRELGERLVNAGIKPIQIRYSAICVHLYHQRSYAASSSIVLNRKIRNYTKKNKVVSTPFGINKTKEITEVKNVIRELSYNN